jgi:hypothetical protein
MMKKNKKAELNKLPKTLFVYQNEDDPTFPWLDAQETIEEAADKQARIVGVYELKELRHVRLEVTEQIITTPV